MNLDCRTSRYWPLLVRAMITLSLYASPKIQSTIDRLDQIKNHRISQEKDTVPMQEG